MKKRCQNDGAGDLGVPECLEMFGISVSEAMSCSQKTNSQMVFSSRCRWQRQGIRWVQGMLDGFPSAHSEK